jgi:mannose/fructose/N-acetylgalactosamine-specific phosphotransferase system component IIC
MHAASFLPLTLLAAVLGLDVVSFPQAMISRPIIAATLAGALAGDPMRGLVIGVTLELVALETLPFGASFYPEWGSASVVAGGLYANYPESSIGGLAIFAFAGIITASVGGWTMVQHRKMIAKWAGGMRGELAAGSTSAITSLQLRGMTADLVRGGVLAWVALMLFAPAGAWAMAHWNTGAAPSRGFVVAIAGMVAAGAVWKVIHSTKGAPWYFFGGLVAGALLLLLA